MERKRACPLVQLTTDRFAGSLRLLRRRRIVRKNLFNGKTILRSGNHCRPALLRLPGDSHVDDTDRHVLLQFLFETDVQIAIHPHAGKKACRVTQRDTVPLHHLGPGPRHIVAAADEREAIAVDEHLVGLQNDVATLY